MNIVLVTMMVLAALAAIQTFLSLRYFRRAIETAANEAFGEGWDACVNATRSHMSDTEIIRVKRHLP